VVEYFANLKKNSGPEFRLLGTAVLKRSKILFHLSVLIKNESIEDCFRTSFSKSSFKHLIPLSFKSPFIFINTFARRKILEELN
jgi:hypothetical protein